MVAAADICTIGNDYVKAIELVWRVFNEFEAPDCEKDGIAEFRRFLDRTLETEQDVKMKGRFVDGKLAGVIVVRPPCHICPFFTDKQYHTQARYPAVADGGGV
jgi:hypothetical protein